MRKLIFISALSFFVSCVLDTQNENEANSEKSTFKSPSEFLDVPKQFFQIYTTSDTSIIGLGGTIIDIPKNCFQTDEVQVKVELREYYCFADIIMSGLSTTSNEDILETGGMIYINAYSAVGDTITLRPDKKCTVIIPSENQNMSLFYGTKDQDQVNWNVDTTYSTIDIAEGEDTTVYRLLDNIKKTNLFRISRLGWINSDKFLDIPDEKKTDLFVSLPPNETGAVYCLAFYSYNSIMPGFPDNNGLTFSGVPAGEKVTLIALGSKDESIYYSMLDITTDSKGKQLTPLKEITKGQLKVELDKKFGVTLSNRHQPSF